MKRAQKARPTAKSPRPARTAPAPVPPTPTDPDALLKPPEIAAFLRLPVSSIYEQSRLGAQGRLPLIRLGRYVRARRRDLEDWLDQQRVGGNGAA